jgi:hypothetical protein
MRITYLRLATVLALSLFLPERAPSQSQPPPQDLFQQQVGGLSLDGQTIVDAVAKLSQNRPPAYSVEFELGKTISEGAPPVRSLVAEVAPGTISEVLDRLCTLDTTFTWKRVGNTANLFPRSLDGDPNYLLNRRAAVVTFTNVPDAEKAVFEAVGQLAGPKEQIAVLQTGVSLTFAKSWTATFRDITIREAFDQIAQQFGPSYGWQFGGAADFRVITFHQFLAAKPRHAAR